MSQRSTPLLFSLLGLGFGVAGATKLAGFAPQRALFHSWGWSDQARQVVGALELGGATLLVSGRTRGWGGLVLAATSAVVLATEGRNHDDTLIPPRAVLLLGALAALV